MSEKPGFVYTHGFTTVWETNGATVVKNHASLGFPTGLGAVSFDLVMPAIVLKPGDRFRWDFVLQTLMYTGRIGGFAEVDFLNTASLSLTLPEGFEGALSADGVNPAPFSWITVASPPTPEPVPEPGTVALFASGLVVLLARGRRSRTVGKRPRVRHSWRRPHP